MPPTVIAGGLLAEADAATISPLSSMASTSTVTRRLNPTCQLAERFAAVLIGAVAECERVSENTVFDEPQINGRQVAPIRGESMV
jgi:hypothetical protein